MWTDYLQRGCLVGQNIARMYKSNGLSKSCTFCLHYSASYHLSTIIVKCIVTGIISNCVANIHFMVLKNRGPICCFMLVCLFVRIITWSFIGGSILGEINIHWSGRRSDQVSSLALCLTSWTSIWSELDVFSQKFQLFPLSLYESVKFFDIIIRINSKFL